MKGRFYFKETGNANFWYIGDNESQSWFAVVQLNGEMTDSQQREHIASMAEGLNKAER